MIISLNGTIIRLQIDDISIMGRSTQGVTLMKMNDDRVVAVAKYVEG
jgi:DNA gyrase subunit A (EC 5.99.1.3)